MIKKIVISLVAVVLMIFVYEYIYDKQRLKSIASIVISSENQKYITKIDQEVGIGGPVSIETYVFKILDENKINCDTFTKMNFTKDSLIHLDKKYINSKKQYCEKYINDNSNRLLQLMIQDDILIINIFID